MSQDTSAAPVLPLPAGEAPPAPVAPQAASPAAEAANVPQGTIEPPASTATLTAGVATQLRTMFGVEKPKTEADQPADASGTEPSPEANAESNQSPPVEEDDERPTHGGDLNAALAETRRAKREVKQELKAAKAENLQLLEKLADFESRFQALETGKVNGNSNGNTNGNGKANGHATPSNGNGDRTSGPAAPVPAELAQAEAHVAKIEDTRNWASHQFDKLSDAFALGADADAVLAAIREELAGQDIAVPEAPAAARQWLKGIRDKADAQLATARVTTELLRHDVAADHAFIRRESEELAARWLPDAKDPAKPQGQKLAKLLDTFPGLDQHPMGKRFLALAVKGWELVEPELNKANGANGKATNGNGAHAAPRAVTPAKPTPVLPGASSALPPRPGGEVVNNSSAAMKRMTDATTPEEFAAAKADWMKALATTTSLAAAR